jgi:hypothetical protein
MKSLCFLYVPLRGIFSVNARHASNNRDLPLVFRPWVPEGHEKLRETHALPWGQAGGSQKENQPRDIFDLTPLGPSRYPSCSLIGSHIRLALCNELNL